MRVLVVTGLTHWGAGGVERETERLLAALVERGVETGFVVDRDVGIPGVARFPIGYPPGAAAPGEIQAAMRSFRPDLVHLIGGGFRVIRATNRVTRVPWLLTIHNLPPRERSGPLFHGQNTLHYGARTALALGSVALWAGLLRAGAFSGAVVHSSGVRRDAARLGCPEDRLHLIPLGADFQETESPGDAKSLFPSDASPKIASVGGLIHHKGFHDYLVVVKRLLERFPKLHYAVIGAARDSRYCAYLPERIRQLGLERSVSVLTDASNAVRDATVGDADLYVQPSHEEGFCLTFAEGAARVARVVGTRTGAMAELGQDDPAIRVVPPKSPAALEAATTELLGLSFDARTTLEARRERLRSRFSWTRHAQEHIELYQRTAAGAPRA